MVEVTELAPIEVAAIDLHAPERQPDASIDVSHPAAAGLVAEAFVAGYSNARTAAAYRRDLLDFFAFCSTEGTPPLRARRHLIDRWARGLERDGLAPATVARRLASVAGFFRYAVGEGILAGSPVAHVRRPRVAEDSQTLGPDREELARLLDVAEAAGARDHALVAMLGLLGLRVSEACAARIEDLGDERGHRTLAIQRKGGRRAVLPLPPRVARAIDLALAYHGDQPTWSMVLRDDPLGSPRTSGVILRAVDGSDLDRHDATRIVRRVARAAGISKHLSPHSLRHGFVTVGLEAGVPLHRVQDAAGHADPRTTRRYDRARNALDGHAAYGVAAFIAG